MKVIEKIEECIVKNDFESALSLIFEHENELLNNADYWNLRGVLSLKVGEYKTAFNCFEQSLKLFPKNGDVIFNLAYSLEKLGDSIGAKYCYNLAYFFSDDQELQNDIISMNFKLETDFNKLLNMITTHFPESEWISKIDVDHNRIGHDSNNFSDESKKKKVLIGSPIHQKPQILKYFLKSLSRLNNDGIEVYYLFIDDNIEKESSKLLQEFSKKEKNVMITKSEFNDNYIRSENTHIWNEHLIWKVATFKDKIIQIANEFNFDYLFLVDSDLILHPYTLQQLLSANKDIISNIFWTKWKPEYPPLPQVWMFDQYEQYKMVRGKKLTKSQIIKRHREFIETLKKPGVYEVGGLGACTLISQKAIKAGVSFKEIKNISFWGEDRHFCVRAQALGFNLFVDTHFPAFHIYRDSDLDQAKEFFNKTNNILPKMESFQIISTVNEGIEKLYTDKFTDLRNYFTNDFFKFFQSIYSNLSQIHVKDIHVCDVVIKKLENHGSVSFVDFKLIIIDHKNEDKRILCTATLQKKHNKWLINEIHIVKELDKISPKKIRLDRKKEVTLIYTNFSGSNTVALYKMLPTTFKEKMKINLVKQTYTRDYYTKIKSSDVIVITEGNLPFLNPNDYRSNQIVIDLWHGFPLKSMGYKDKSDFNVERIGRTWDKIDYISSYSKLFSEKMNECIKTDPSKFIITGAPRNDLFSLKVGKKLLSKIFKKDFTNKKCIFYLPTFRFSNMKKVNEGRREWNNLFDFNNFNEDKFNSFLQNENIELVVKLHPAEENLFLNKIKKFNNINILTNPELERNKIDLYELLGAADVLITDYSSVYFDFLLLNKPIIFTQTDLEIYSQNRGFLFDFEEFTPGPKVTNQHQLEEEILKSIYENTYYENERNRVKNLVHFYKDNQSSLRVWEFIFNL